MRSLRSLIGNWKFLGHWHKMAVNSWWFIAIGLIDWPDCLFTLKTYNFPKVFDTQLPEVGWSIWYNLFCLELGACKRSPALLLLYYCCCCASRLLPPSSPVTQPEQQQQQRQYVFFWTSKARKLRTCKCGALLLQLRRRRRVRICTFVIVKQGNCVPVNVVRSFFSSDAEGV